MGRTRKEVGFQKPGGFRFMKKSVALVTGASRGIGRAIALMLARQGHSIVVNFRTDIEGAEKTLAEIESSGGQGFCIQGDVSSSTSVDELFTSAEELAGAVSILVNNAGVCRDGLALRLSDEAWSDVIETNLSGPFFCTRRALPSMLRNQWGRIVNISSVAGLMGNPGQANYSAAKAGLIGLTKTLAREVGSRNITVNAIAPGYVLTDLTAEVLSGASSGHVLDRVPCGRLGTAVEIASGVAFFCSDDASYVNGAVLTADGGMTA